MIVLRLLTVCWLVKYFEYTNRRDIYVSSTYGGLRFEDVQFPIDYKRAEEIAIDAIKSIFTISATKKGKEKIICKCGSSFRKNGIREHERSLKHLNFINSKNTE